MAGHRAGMVEPEDEGPTQESAEIADGDLLGIVQGGTSHGNGSFSATFSPKLQILLGGSSGVAVVTLVEQSFPSAEGHGATQSVGEVAVLAAPSVPHHMRQGRYGTTRPV